MATAESMGKSATARLDIPTPRWALPLLQPAEYKGAYGGRSAGKSHFFAELLVEECVADPSLSAVCIREVQRSLKFSAKRLIEDKIKALGVEHYFSSTRDEIRRRGGDGVIIFQGMQDHTAESIKSLEGFKRAWVEEAQSLSDRSLGLLLPTIREEDSQIWFSWNPQHPTDPVDRLMRGDRCDPAQTIAVCVTYLDNPFVTQKTLREAKRHRELTPDNFDHVWLGHYVELSEAIIFAGRWRVAPFEPGEEWDGPYHGLDFGFAQDPTAGVRCWIHDERLWIEYEAGRKNLKLADTADYLTDRIPGIAHYEVRADSSRPESIKHLQENGLPRCVGAKKGPGSVEDGISHLLSYREIVIHPRCTQTQEEFRRYQYKVDRLSGEVKREPLDAYNHFVDATRYALEPIIRRSSGPLLGRA